MWITLEAEPGEDIYHAVDEGIRLSKILGVGVWFNFNGVRIYTAEYVEANDVIDKYRAALKSNTEHKIV